MGNGKAETLPIKQIQGQMFLTLRINNKVSSLQSLNSILSLNSLSDKGFK